MKKTFRIPGFERNNVETRSPSTVSRLPVMLALCSAKHLPAKRLIFLLALQVAALLAGAQTATVSLTTAPCHDDGVLTVTASGLTPPLTVAWSTMGISAATITHTGVPGLTDALTGYSGGPVIVTVTDGVGDAYAYFGGAPPFTYGVTPVEAMCPALGTLTAAVTGGTPPYSYQWFDASTLATVGTTNPVSLAPGNYGITITDAAGCTYGSLVSPDTAYLFGIPAFSVPVSTTPAGCTNGTVTTGAITGGTPLLVTCGPPGLLPAPSPA